MSGLSLLLQYHVLDIVHICIHSVSDTGRLSIPFLLRPKAFNGDATLGGPHGKHKTLETYCGSRCRVGPGDVLRFQESI